MVDGPCDESVIELPPSLGALVDAVMDRDREWFAAHPDKDQYIRMYVPGEASPLSPDEMGRVAYVRVHRGPVDQIRLREFLGALWQPL